MAKKIDRLSSTIMTLLKARGLDGRLSEYRIVEQWEKSVGTVIARHAQPTSVRGKKLTLIVDSPAWMQQLSLLKPELVEKVNNNLGRDAVRDIILKLGEVMPLEKPEDEVPARAALTPEERTKIAQHVQAMGDPDMREALLRVIEKDFLRKKRE